MQFEHAHGFRPQVRDLLRAEWPEAWQHWLDLGAEPVDLPLPGVATPAVGVRSRRATYERALRRAAADVDGLTVEVGHVTRLVERHGRVVGVVADGAAIEADLVIDASGTALQADRAAAGTRAATPASPTSTAPTAATTVPSRGR